MRPLTITLIVTFFLLVSTVSAMAAPEVPGDLSPIPVITEQESPVHIYQTSPLGVNVIWTDAPVGADEYGCHFVFRNMYTGEIVHEVDTYSANWMNQHLVIEYLFDLQGKYWEFVGGDDKIPTSACWAIYPWGSYSWWVNETKVLDFRFKVYQPFLSR